MPSNLLLKSKAKKVPPKKRGARGVTPLQKQKQSQRVIVNVNQPKRAPAKRRAQPRQVSYQPIITMSGSVPVPQPYYNPYPIQSSAGFNPSQPVQSLGTPISAPVELPVFAKESPIAIGDEDVLMPILKPVKTPVPVPVPVKEPSIINENRPVIRTPPPIIAPSPISIPSPPTSIISKPSLITDKSSSQFIKPVPPPDDNKSVSSLLSELSKDTGINSKSIADFIFKKKKQESKPPAPPPSVASSNMSVPTSIATDNTKAEYLFLDDRSIPAPESISSMSGFNPPSEKSSIKSKPIITTPKEVVVLKKPELKRSNPYDLFSDNESVARDVPMAEDIASDAATQGTYKTKIPIKKRQPQYESDSDKSDSGANIIPLDKPAGRRLAPVSETKQVKGKSPYSSLTAAEITRLAEKQGIQTKRKGSKGQDVRVPAKDLLPLLT
jgi:hypothetical protein